MSAPDDGGGAELPAAARTDYSVHPRHCLKFQGRSVCNVRANPVIIHLHEDEARQTCRDVSAAGLPDVAVGLEYALSNDRRR